MHGRKPPQEPVDIPEHLSHGTSYVHRHYRCRCEECQEWRRSYDRNRDSSSRRGIWEPLDRRWPTRRPWYVCARDGRRHANHRYMAGQCVRCDAEQGIEELWERKWRGDLK